MYCTKIGDKGNLTLQNLVPQLFGTKSIFLEFKEFGVMLSKGKANLENINLFLLAKDRQVSKYWFYINYFIKIITEELREGTYFNSKSCQIIFIFLHGL